jgi:hypothetical protein
MLPAGCANAFLPPEPEVRLIDQNRGAQGVVAMPALALPVGDQAKLFVEHVDE